MNPKHPKIVHETDVASYNTTTDFSSRHVHVENQSKTGNCGEGFDLQIIFVNVGGLLQTKALSPMHYGYAL